MMAFPRDYDKAASDSTTSSFELRGRLTRELASTYVAESRGNWRL